MVQAAQDEYDTYGMSASQIAKLTLSRLEDACAVQLLTALTFEDLRHRCPDRGAENLIAIYERASCAAPMKRRRAKPAKSGTAPSSR